MATVREGHAGALVVVDVQVGLVRDAREAPRVSRNVARAVERARAQGVPVIWVQHSSEPGLPHGSPPWRGVPERVPARVPAEGEARIDQRFESSFEQTASLTYPGRTNGSASAEAIDFAATPGQTG